MNETPENGNYLYIDAQTPLEANSDRFFNEQNGTINDEYMTPGGS